MSFLLGDFAISLFRLLFIGGGGVVVGITWLDTFFFALAIIFAIGGLSSVIIIFVLFRIWLKEQASDNVANQVVWIMGELPKITEDLKASKGKLGI